VIERNAVGTAPSREWRLLRRAIPFYGADWAESDSGSAAGLGGNSQQRLPPCRQLWPSTAPTTARPEPISARADTRITRTTDIGRHCRLGGVRAGRYAPVHVSGLRRQPGLLARGVVVIHDSASVYYIAGAMRNGSEAGGTGWVLWGIRGTGREDMHYKKQDRWPAVVTAFTAPSPVPSGHQHARPRCCIHRPVHLWSHHGDRHTTMAQPDRSASDAPVGRRDYPKHGLGGTATPPLRSACAGRPSRRSPDGFSTAAP
jgi:hypothetical protein